MGGRSVGKGALHAGGPAAVVALVAVAALLRFSTLSSQSYWYDESITVDLMRHSLGDMLDGVRGHEATPPLYFVLAWLWTHAFGDSEVGLRSFSALVGTLTVPVAYLAARELTDRGIGLVVAALTACSPGLVWYSQEARSYALLVLLCALSLLFFARSRARSDAWSYAGWAAASALALWTHYFALLFVAPAALVLLARAGHRRAAAAAVAAVAVAAAALIPLAAYQRTHGGVHWIESTDFGTRVAQVPYFFVTGALGFTLGPLVLLVAAAASGLAWAGVRREPSAHVRTGALLALFFGVVCLAIPIAGKLAGSDYVLSRNLLPAWLPLAIFMAVGLRARLGPRLALPGLAVLAVAYVAVNIVIASWPHAQRDDWRSAARALGPGRSGRVLVVAPRWQALTLGLYRPGLRAMPSRVPIDEVITVTFTGPVPFDSPVRTVVPAAPFRPTRRLTLERFALTWYTAPRAVLASPASLSGAGPNGSSPFID